MKRRLKIAEQILIVLPLALMIPLIIASAVIINTNQIAVRKELVSAATIIADSIHNELSTLRDFEKNNLLYFSKALEKMPSQNEKKAFIENIMHDNNDIIDISVVSLPNSMIVEQKYNSTYLPAKKALAFSYIDEQNNMFSKIVSIDYLEKKLFSNFDLMGRQIYLLDKNKNLIIAKDYEKQRLDNILAVFPKEFSTEEPEQITLPDYKNQPNIIIYDENYDLYIVVSSPKNLTDYGIIEARRKIIWAICVAAATVFILFGFYTFSLYTNIRQIFKVIQAISAGNYMKKIRVLTNPLTSQEIIFIADEFNKMIEKIGDSYRKLNESNKKLKQLYDYKTNLIDTVSHEFRTPLTSIKGYSSSLLRHDVQLDDDSRKKSLKIIKQQAERLSRMVEDLLVIPDIESATLRINLTEVNLKNAIETSILSTIKGEDNLFVVNVQEDIKPLYADEDRLIQILINLLENALKYSKENTKINLVAFSDEDFATIKVTNEADYIDAETLNNLFEKFTRLDSDLTRTTRGTGLGLFIVKGLIETMGGKVNLNSYDNLFEVVFTIPVYKGQDDVTL